MKKINHDIVRLTDILQAICDIEDYQLTGLSKKKDIHAVCYNIAVIGEAAGKISADLTKQYTDIPWSQITGIRHKVIHDYGKVDTIILQDVIDNRLPQLKTAIKAILNKLDDAS